MSVTSPRLSVSDRLVRCLPVSVRRRWWFWREQHRWLPLRRPRTFSEKVNWRIVNDRRPLLDGTCDKLAMKETAHSRCGDLPLRVPKTWWSGRDLDELETVDLPDRWILKPNHRCKLLVIGGGKPDVAALRDRTRGWLDERNAAILGEWAYGEATRTMLAEEWIGNDDAPATEYLVLVFDGVPQFLQVVDGGTAISSQRWYTAAWEPLPYKRLTPLAPATPAPAELPIMLEVARRLAEGFDFLRVDLYVADGQVWFGELTPYSHGGHPPGPREFDEVVGAFWHLPAVTR